MSRPVLLCILAACLVAADPPPSPLTCTATGSDRIAVSWAACSGATAYEVQRSRDLLRWITVATPAGTTCTDTGLAAGTLYHYRARAAGGAWSNWNYAVTLSPTAAGPAPWFLLAQWTPEGAVRVTWDDHCADETACNQCNCNKLHFFE